eukprot:CCRYP_010275-RA/>CCRYP_010275-RA protein AED:0.43 eAED:0.43 QI:0/0/0/1/0/0/4/0/331
MDFNPPVEDVQEVELFIGATIGEQNPGTIYTDQTGHFPVRSFHGKRYQFVAYEYRSNAILVRALADQTDKSMLEAFQDVYAYLTKRGFQPKLNVMDNQCSKTIQSFIETKGAKIQLVHPDDHRGQFEFNKTPLAPVGTKALVFLDPKKRTSWNTHAVDVWYVGPAKKHYRNFKFYIPETRGYKIVNTAKFYPQHCKRPAIEPGDSIRLAAQDLISALLHHNLTEALRQLSKIFTQTVDGVQPVQKVPAESNPSTVVYQLVGQHIKQATQHFIPTNLTHDTTTFQDNILLDHMANGVVHPVTQETITKYKKLANDPIMHEVWMKGMCKELGR